MKSNSNQIVLNKLKWHSRRSMLELDLYLNNFLNTYPLEEFLQEDLLIYQSILQLDDQELLDLINHKITSSNSKIQKMILKINNFK